MTPYHAFYCFCGSRSMDSLPQAFPWACVPQQQRVGWPSRSELPFLKLGYGVGVGCR